MTTTGVEALTRPWRPQNLRGWRLVAVCASSLALFGFTLWLRYRTVGITALSFDDAWVADAARVGTIGEAIRTGLTSPGFSLVYREWAQILGASATTAQLLSLLFAVVTPTALLLVLLERGLPLLPAAVGGTLIATATTHIEYSTHLKQYSAEALATTVLLWVAWRVVESATDGRRWAVLAGVAIGASPVSGITTIAAGTAIAVCFLAASLSRPRRMLPAVVWTVICGIIVGAWTWFALRPNVSGSGSTLTRYWRGYYLDGPGFAGGIGTRLEGVVEGFHATAPLLVGIALLCAAVLVLVRQPLVGLLLVAPTLVAVILAALTIVPLGAGRIDIYLYPSYAMLAAVAINEITLLLSAGEWITGAVAVLALVGLAVHATPITEHAYPAEDLTPLVHMAEQDRRAGDLILVYPSTGFAYGLATRYPISTQPDRRSATGWVVKVRGPNIVVLPPHRNDPGRWGPQLDRLTVGSRPIWLVGSHLYRGPGELFPDWPVLLTMLRARGYETVKAYARPDAVLLRLAPKDPGG